MNCKNAIIVSIFLLVLVSCQKTDRFGMKSAPKIEVKIKRFDKSIISIDTANIDSELRKLYKTYPGFMSDYINEVMDENPSDTTAVKKLLLDYLSDTAFVGVNKKVLEVFADVSSIEKDISGAFSGLNYLFPDIKLPEIFFFVSGFNRSVLKNDNFIAIGSDLFLGSDYSKYAEISYQYLTVNMCRQAVPVDIVSALIYTSFPNKSNEERLLDLMIYKGKLLFLLSVLLPDTEPQNIMGYTKAKMDWAEKFEKEIWSSMIENKHLFSTDTQLINKYINDAPFTAPVSQESPGRLATWIGWRIVESYMNTNKSTRLQELMKENDCQKILENSGYKP
ncbi:MAG: hypothetical protein Q7U47_00560 [Paludibacter sp.]|nr:hypothetical protein [Paludibacter sp.]